MILHKKINMSNASVTKLSIAGIFIGVMAYMTPGSVFVFALAALSIYLILGRCSADEKKFIFGIFLAGFVSRIIICSIIQVIAIRYNIGYRNECLGIMIPDICPDSGGYSLRGWVTSEFLKGRDPGLGVLDPSWFFYDVTDKSFNFLIYTIFYYFFGFAQLSAKFINCLLGVLSGILVYFITDSIFGKKEARIAALLTVFFPSIFMWSMTNLKEAPTVLVICAAVITIIKFNHSGKFFYAALALAIAYLMEFLRPHFLIPVMAATVVSLVACLGRRYPRIFFLICLAMIILISVFFSQILSFTRDMFLNVMERFIAVQKGFLSTGGDVYEIYGENDQQLIGGAMTFTDFSFYLAKGAVYFLFTPFPWDMRSLFQLIAYPQIMLWYFLAAAALFGFLGINKKNAVDAIIISFFIFFITMMFSLVSGNIGTAFRHRDIVLPLFFVFSSAGLVRLFDGRVKADG